MSGVEEEIKEQIAQHDVLLFMKGSPSSPRCGFSASLVATLEAVGITFQSIDVLQDEEIRQGIKEFSNWPTIPQLYVKGEFLGGCDAVTEMHESGELQQLLQEKGLIPA